MAKTLFIALAKRPRRYQIYRCPLRNVSFRLSHARGCRRSRPLPETHRALTPSCPRFGRPHTPIYTRSVHIRLPAHPKQRRRCGFPIGSALSPTGDRPSADRGGVAVRCVRAVAGGVVVFVVAYEMFTIAACWRDQLSSLERRMAVTHLEHYPSPQMTHPDHRPLADPPHRTLPALGLCNPP